MKLTEDAFLMAPKKAIRDGFGLGLVELARSNSKVVAIDADLRDSVRLTPFMKEFPDRFFEVGVAEQNLVGVAAGLAKEGFVAFAGSYAAFSPGRDYDQIRVSICYSNRNVKIIGGHAGLTVGPDGATHQMMEDLAMMRALPNMTIVVPSDDEMARELTKQMGSLSTPVYLRSSRIETFSLTKAEQIELGKALVMKTGEDLTIVSCGVMIDRALQLAFDLEKLGVKTAVLNMHTLKPLDEKTLLEFAKKSGKVITIEEHQIHGGLGSAVAETLSQQLPTPLKIIGMPDSFGQSGQSDDLLDYYGFGRETLLEAAKQLLKT